MSALEIPDVSATPLGTVLVELAPSDAQTLARILAHYDVLTSFRGPEGERISCADGWVPEVWHHTLIALLAEAERARWRTPPVLVPIRTSAQLAAQEGTHR
jgi:hypothetical protein